MSARNAHAVKATRRVERENRKALFQERRDLQAAVFWGQQAIAAELPDRVER